MGSYVSLYASFSLINITLQVIESSKSKIMSAIRIAKNGIDNQGFRIKNTKQQQSGKIQQQTRILKICKNLNF
jgi:ribosome-associated toxin RatA of RatAB toxin-antitoxin module